MTSSSIKADIQCHGQANIKEAQYGVDFFRKFDLVLNGLDNLEARRHVNRLCLAAGTPLVESGTAGYLGQVMPAPAPSVCLMFQFGHCSRP